MTEADIAAAGAPLVPGIAALAPRYDAFVVDLWGVLHDGVAPFPEALDALAQLRRRGGRVGLLSNAPRRAETVIERLDELGVPRGLYDVVMTSGEAAHAALRDRDDPFSAALGRRCLHLGPRRDDSLWQGLDLEIADDPATADFVLNTGPDRYDDTLEESRPLLDACLARGLPMVCANPDLVVLVGPQRAFCAGTLAAYYEQGGGRVAYHGKPHAPIYRRCLALLGEPDRARVLAIGDSLATDIAGAAAAGIDSLLVTGGIHGEEWALVPGGPPDPARLARALARAGAGPVAAVERLRW